MSHAPEDHARGRYGSGAGVEPTADARGLAVGAAVLERVRTTHDLATLDHWVRRAVVVACAEEVFDD